MGRLPSSPINLGPSPVPGYTFRCNKYKSFRRRRTDKRFVSNRIRRRPVNPGGIFHAGSGTTGRGDGWLRSGLAVSTDIWRMKLKRPVI